MSHSTVITQKQVFLRRQKQILTRGIPPSGKLLRIADQGGIQSKVLNDVLLKGAHLSVSVSMGDRITIDFFPLTEQVNRDLRRHGRKVYSSQMTDHVVDQIDLLYYEAGAPRIDDDDAESGNPDALYQGDNLTLDENIGKLPSTWETSGDAENEADGGGAEVNQDDYIKAVARLQDLSARRLTLQQKLNTYKTFLSLLEPYRGPQENIQPNLVGRDAPLASELAQTRTLAIRVAGRIDEKLGDADFLETDDGNDVLMLEDGDEKLKKVLSGW